MSCGEPFFGLWLKNGVLSKFASLADGFGVNEIVSTHPTTNLQKSVALV